MTIFAENALLPEGWTSDVRVSFASGRIGKVTRNTKPEGGDTLVPVLLPAISNLHSHTFQRAMAGRSEYQFAHADSFWTWRTLLYRFLNHLTPEHIEAIAAQAFVEMQKAGYAAVGEFHYLHHQMGGVPYDDRAELSKRIIAAAQRTGIGLTLLPALYSYGGALREPLEGGQLRFGNSLERYLSLFEDCAGALAPLGEDAVIGIAPHSLRAVPPQDLSELCTEHPDALVHLHIAEQEQEVAEIRSFHGARPVEWLLQNADVNERWCLIHATHMTEAETIALAHSKAVAGLCPVTEANLGDGIFAAAKFLEAGGHWGVGTDSNVAISLNDELRTLEYSQRLRDRARNILSTLKQSTGSTLYLHAAKGGAQALGRASGKIAEGLFADFIAIDRVHPSLFGLSEAQLLDGFCFSATSAVVTDTWSAGRHMVREGKHIDQFSVYEAFKETMKELSELL
ncbi:MAG: formimidoylglutamate deiminase [Paracoccaceae bacterium]